MPAFVQGKRGVVTRIVGPWKQIAPLTMRLRDVVRNNSMSQLVMTGGSLDASELYCLQPTMEKDMFIYTFGSNPSDVVLTGFAISTCDSSAQGANVLLNTYNRNRIGKTGKPTYLDIAGHAFPALLVGMSLGIVDPLTALVQFSLKVKVLPR